MPRYTMHPMGRRLVLVRGRWVSSGREGGLMRRMVVAVGVLVLVVSGLVGSLSWAGGPPPIAVDTAPKPALGVVVAPDSAADFDALTSLGATWVRYAPEFGWGPETLTEFSRIVAQAHARGIKVLALALTADPHRWPVGWDGIAAFANYAADLAVRGADAVEVWNEPNNPVFANGAPSSISFGFTVIVASHAIRAARPGVPVISGGLGSSGDLNNWTTNALHPVIFLQEVLTAFGDNFLNAVDGIGEHPYIFPGNPLDPRTYGWNGCLFSTQLWNMTHKPLWFTEFGSPSSAPLAPPGGEDGKAKWLGDYFTAFNNLELAGVTLGPHFYYTLRNGVGDGTGDPAAATLGLLAVDYTDLPAAVVFRTRSGH
jgi:hypothetical protein